MQWCCLPTLQFQHCRRWLLRSSAACQNILTWGYRRSLCTLTRCCSVSNRMQQTRRPGQWLIVVSRTAMGVSIMFYFISNKHNMFITFALEKKKNICQLTKHIQLFFNHILTKQSNFSIVIALSKIDFLDRCFCIKKTSINKKLCLLYYKLWLLHL